MQNWKSTICKTWSILKESELY